MKEKYDIKNRLKEVWEKKINKSNIARQKIREKIKCNLKLTLHLASTALSSSFHRFTTSSYTIFFEFLASILACSSLLWDFSSWKARESNGLNFKPIVQDQKSKTSYSCLHNVNCSGFQQFSNCILMGVFSHNTIQIWAWKDKMSIYDDQHHLVTLTSSVSRGVDFEVPSRLLEDQLDCTEQQDVSSNSSSASSSTSAQPCNKVISLASLETVWYAPYERQRTDKSLPWNKERKKARVGKPTRKSQPISKGFQFQVPWLLHLFIWIHQQKCRGNF